MGLLGKLERGIENVTDRTVSRFSGGIEPVEVALRLREAMDECAVSFVHDRSVILNIFRIHLTLPSIGCVTAWAQDEMTHQMEETIISHATDQDYSFVGPVEVSLFVNNNPNAPAVEIESSMRRGVTASAASVTAIPAHPVIDTNGQRCLLTRPVIVTGRDSEANIIVGDSSASRRHLEIRLTYGNTVASDLGSTSDTLVEGQRADVVALMDGNTLTVDRTQILFWDGTQNGGING